MTEEATSPSPLRQRVEIVYLGVDVLLDLLWRWQNTKYEARVAGSRSLHRWAHRHGF